MKKVCEKISFVLEKIIGISFGICLFAGGLGFIGFVIALIIGGDTALTICTWLSGTYYVFLIKLSTITTVLCFLLAYINGEAKFVNPFKKTKE